MFWKNSKIENEKLDKIGKLLLKSAALSNEEADQMASSPQIYNRLRANIIKESLIRSEASDNWFAIWSIARYAVPLMAGIAVIAFSSFWILETHLQQVTTVSSSNYLPADINILPVTACSISSKTECIVSSNDVLSIVFQEQTTEIKNESAK